MRVGLILETLTHLCLALTTTPGVAMAIFFLFGAHAFIWGTTSRTVRMRAVPTGCRGASGASTRSASSEASSSAGARRA